MRITTKRRQSVALAVVLALAAIGIVRTFGAQGVTARATEWGTFAHIATNDIADEDDRDDVVQSYDLLALRGKLTPELLADLRTRRPGIVLLAYDKAAGLSDSEVAVIEDTNPEWIALDEDGDEIHPQSIPDVTLGDLTNPAFREWVTNKFVAEVASGTDGVFIDTLGAYFPEEFYTARPVVNGDPVTDAAWRDGSIDLITRIKAATGSTVVANGFGLQNGKNYTDHQADADQLIAAADGVQIEAFTRNSGASASQYATATRLNQDIGFLDSLRARNKLTLAYTKVRVSASSSELDDLRDYALAAFLLGFAPGQSYFGISDDEPIAGVSSDASWARGLGAPTAPRVRSDGEEWSRQFTGGRLTLRAGSAPVVTGATTTTRASTSTSRATSTTRASTSTTRASTSTTRASTSTTGASTTTTRASTTTTRASTTTTRASTTTTTGTARRTATFSGEGPERNNFRVTVGAGSVTATVTSRSTASWTVRVFSSTGELVAGPVTSVSPATLTASLPAGRYTFAVEGSAARDYTLQVNYPSPTSTVASSRPMGGAPTAAVVVLALLVLAIVPALRRRGAQL